MRERKRTGVIITAAGLSRRMGEFKPLLLLGNKTIIEHMIDNARFDGMEETVVVVGREKEKLAEKLKDKNVKIVENRDFESSDMLTSIKCGIRKLSDHIECFFIIPGDMPLVSKACYQCMLAKYESSKDPGIVQVRYQESGGHPILIPAKYREHILAYGGGRGLKGALKPFQDDIQVLRWHESSVLVDMDTPSDFEFIKMIYERKRIPRKMAIFDILNRNQVSIEVVHHSLAVEKIALLIAEHARKKGYPMNLSLISAAALLHDVERAKPNHAQKGAQLLRKLGYDQVAEIVEEHMFISSDAMEHIDERAVVFLADKLVQEDRAVSIDERFEKRLLEFEDNPEVYQKIQKNKENAVKLEKILL